MHRKLLAMAFSGALLAGTVTAATTADASASVVGHATLAVDAVDSPYDITTAPDDLTAANAGQVEVAARVGELPAAEDSDGAVGTGELSPTTATADDGDPNPAVNDDGAFSPDSVFGTDQRKKVADTTKFPAAGIVHVHYKGGSCTGFLIGVSVVATAAHCIYRDHKWKTGYKVYAGRNGSYLPFGSCDVVHRYAPDGWTVGVEDSAFDYGLLKLNCKVGSATGYFGYETPKLTESDLHVSGYPGDKSPAYSQWWSGGPAAQSLDHQFLTYTIDATSGQSGAPLYKSGCVTRCAVAIHAYGKTKTNPKNNLGVQVTGHMESFFKRYK